MQSHCVIERLTVRSVASVVSLSCNKRLVVRRPRSNLTALLNAGTPRQSTHPERFLQHFFVVFLITHFIFVSITASHCFIIAAAVEVVSERQQRSRLAPAAKRQRIDSSGSVQQPIDVDMDDDGKEEKHQQSRAVEIDVGRGKEERVAVVSAEVEMAQSAAAVAPDPLAIILPVHLGGVPSHRLPPPIRQGGRLHLPTTATS